MPLLIIRIKNKHKQRKKNTIKQKINLITYPQSQTLSPYQKAISYLITPKN